MAILLCGCSKEAPPAPIAPTAAVSNGETAAQKAFARSPEPLPAPKNYNTISVAVYPYIPDVALFKELLTGYWAAIEPDVKLEFVEWDCYGNGNPDGIDIFMYDALFTSNLVENGYIQPIAYSDIQNGNDKRIVPFALDGAVYDGELYGIPFLVCSYFLIHKADDAQLAEVDNFPELYEVISERQAEDETTGLQTSYTVNTPFFLPDALMDFSGEYSLYEEIPDISELDESVIDLFTQIQDMQAPTPDLGDITYWSEYSKAFALGQGCAHYGYSEDMCDMGDIIDTLTIRSISFSEKENIPIFFADIASIGAHVTDPQKLEDCKKILNIIASKDFQVDLCLSNNDPQYILPARQSVYDTLKEKYPMYDNLHRLVVNDTNKIYRIGPDIYTYLTNAATNLPF